MMWDVILGLMFGATIILVWRLYEHERAHCQQIGVLADLLGETVMLLDEAGIQLPPQLRDFRDVAAEQRFMNVEESDNG